MDLTIIVIVILVVLVLAVVVTYNGLVKLRNRGKEAWADIDVQLKRRYNLIPNLIETVKGYAKHEREVFENITKARANAVSAEEKGDPKEVAQAENQLQSTLKSLFAVAENYPDLKATNNFMELQKELSDTEDKIQAARRFYNRNVRALNTKIEMFPASIIAGLFGFKKMDFFEIEDPKERENVKVEF